MRIITLNINGIRAGARKGFFDWLNSQDADVVCLQEIKAQTEQLQADIFHPQAYHCIYHSAQKKGYSGVAIYSRLKPDQVITGIGWPDVDDEGRWLEIRLGNLSIISLYLPSGSSGVIRQQFKFDIMNRLTTYLTERAKQQSEIILCGDWNIAHQKRDLKNWKSNQKTSGFLPEERAWLDTVFNDLAYVDAFRAINQETEAYSWWSMRTRAREKNVGWRIDYHVVSPHFRDAISRVEIIKEPFFSDHAPVVIDYENLDYA